MFFFTLLICVPLLSDEPFYYFIPPKHWDVVDPTKLTSRCKIAFVEHSAKTFKPSLNLGVQKVTVSLEKYVEAAKKQHLANRNKKWSELGLVKTKAGIAHLSQIDEKAQVGDIRSMQCMLLYQEHIYIITAVALREDFLDYHNEFLSAFESFSIYKNALQSIRTEELKDNYHTKIDALLQQWTLFLQASKDPHDPKKAFEDRLFRKGPWKDFEKFLSKHFKDQGIFWQVMASKEVRTLLEKS